MEYHMEKVSYTTAMDSSYMKAIGLMENSMVLDGYTMLTRIYDILGTGKMGSGMGRELRFYRMEIKSTRGFGRMDYDREKEHYITKPKREL